MPIQTNPSVSNTGHAPAPWHAEPAPSASSMRSIRDENGKAIAFVNRGPRAAANERLLIAAPAMLALLERLLDTALPSSTLRVPAYLTEAIKDVLRDVSAGEP